MAATGYGPVTGVRLDDPRPFFAPWTADAWGCLRPPLSPEALRLSAELSAACHTLNIVPWLRAGWQDVTVQVDGALTRLEPDWQSLSARMQRRRLRAKIRGANPIQQVRGALREREAASTGKAVVMLHPAPDGRYVAAICFMGTGTRFYDWFSNFRISTPEGVHQGFSQLADQFEANEDTIAFPAAASALGLEKLTLRHILQEAKSPDSRFRLWLCGHSQGGAVMQVWARRKLLEEGVLPANLVGYGFASPSVATGRAIPRPEAFPLYHIHNSDDLIPRCGASVHLGVCLTFPADAALRRACYGWPRDEASVQARLAVRPLVRQMADTPSCIVAATALLQALMGCTPAEIAEALGVADSLPASKLLELFDPRETLATLIRRMEAVHRSLTGLSLPENALDATVALTRRIIGETGLKPFTAALGQLLREPHRISARNAGPFASPYAWIALNGASQLIPSIWQPGSPPRKATVPEV